MEWLTKTSTWVPAQGDTNFEYLWLERYTLAFFYLSLSSDDWLSDKHVCEWTGLECRAGRISRLDRGQNKLVGSIPSEIGRLTSLTHLNLGFNQLKGNIPQEIFNLSNLVHLSLANNQLVGSIPTMISSLYSLSHLNLAYNQLTGTVPTLKTLNKLTFVKLESNQLTGIIPADYTGSTTAPVSSPTGY